MFSRVIAKNVGDVFLRHSVYCTVNWLDVDGLKFEIEGLSGVGLIPHHAPPHFNHWVNNTV